MKNIFTFTLATLITVNSFAQITKQASHKTKDISAINKIRHPHNRNKSDINFRTNTSIALRLDSLVGLNYDTLTKKLYNNDKYILSYDKNGNDTVEIFDTLNTKTNQWEYCTKSVYSYKSIEVDTLQVDYNWDTINNIWILSDKYSFYYNSKNNDSLTIYYQWDTTKWTPNTKTTYLYDKNNNDTLQFDSIWYTNKWYISDKINYLYDNKGNNTTTISYNWDSANVWSVSSKTNSYFDANGNDTLDISYNWDSSAFNLESKIKYIYNLNYNKNQTISFLNSYNPGGGFNGWTFNNNNIPIEEDAYEFYNDWYYAGKATFYYSQLSPCTAYYIATYDTLKNTFYISVDTATTAIAKAYLWNFGDGAQSTSAAPTHVYTKDSLYNVCLTITMANNDTCSYCHIIGIDQSGKIYRTAGFNLVIENSASETGIASLSSTGYLVNIYPNPITDNITISISGEHTNLSFELTDIQGSKVAQQSFFNNSQILIPNLASGLYLYKVLENNVPIKVGKLVIQQ